jgi:pyridinium-3,5-biscarboxylic acid mononucleotide synthase
MDKSSLLELLSQVQRGTVTPDSASERFNTLPFAEAGYENIGHARIDHHRALRTGLPEVIYAAGKTPQQTAQIFSRMAAAGHAVLATRATPEAAGAILEMIPAAVHNPIARTVALQAAHPASDPSSLIRDPTPSDGPCVAVLCAGTSDIPVAEEAAVTAELFGSRVVRLFDVGVAGLHRLLSVRDQLGEADAIIVCAGMEGALPSVVGGLVGVPVIAVPTSVGYGASFAGSAALLGMLNSCSPNVVVVNIDNGFGAAYTATMIARASHPASH